MKEKHTQEIGPEAAEIKSLLVCRWRKTVRVMILLIEPESPRFFGGFGTPMYLPMRVHHGQYGDRRMLENLEDFQVNNLSVNFSSIGIAAPRGSSVALRCA